MEGHRTMSVPNFKRKASLLLSEKANQIAHNSIGVFGRRWTTRFLALSITLGCIAGSTGLADLISKTWVSVIAIAASLSTALVILLLTTLKYDAHLRAQTRYQSLFMRTVGCDIRTPEGQAQFNCLWDEFWHVAELVDAEGAMLNRHQIRKYEQEARRELPDDIEEREEAEIFPGYPPRLSGRSRNLPLRAEAKSTSRHRGQDRSWQHRS